MKERKQGGIGMASASTSPCAACKLLRRRCTQECVFAPHFPADEPHKFASVHRVFGASNVNKMLQELREEQRSDAVSSMVYEANARVRDPVYGCVGAISSLQQQIQVLQKQLAIAQAELLQLRKITTTNTSSSSSISIINNNNNNASTSSSSTRSLFSMNMNMDMDMDIMPHHHHPHHDDTSSFW